MKTLNLTRGYLVRLIPCWIVFIVSFSLPALADEFHYINILVGERSAGMAGAYTAISDDPSGCYYNPAGLAYTGGTTLSASVNAYHGSRLLYKDVLPGTDGVRHDFEQTSSALLPNFFGIVQPLGSGKLGLSYAVPDAILRDQEQTFLNITSDYAGIDITSYSLNMNDVDKTYLFGPSYAWKYSDSLAFGGTLYVHYRDRDVITNHFLVYSDNDFEWQNYYESSKEWGLKPILGVMVTPIDKLSIGLSASRIKILSAENRTQRITKMRADSADYETPPPLVVIENNDKRKFPFTTTLGMAYFASPTLLFSGDISYYDKVSDTQKRIVNIALGTEYYINEKLALRGGLYTNNANTPKLSSSIANQNEHIDLYGLSLSLTSFTRSSSVSLGLNYAFGTGDAQAIADDVTVNDIELRNLTVFISATYNS
jgi:long-subunit fatty acid transport protein